MIIFCRVRIAYFFSRPFSLLSLIKESYTLSTTAYKLTEDSEAMRSLDKREKQQAREVGKRSYIGLQSKHYCSEPKAIVLHSLTTSGATAKQ